MIFLADYIRRFLNKLHRFPTDIIDKSLCLNKDKIQASVRQRASQPPLPVFSYMKEADCPDTRFLSLSFPFRLELIEEFFHEDRSLIR